MNKKDLGPTLKSLVRLLGKHATKAHLILLLINGHLPGLGELK